MSTTVERICPVSPARETILWAKSFFCAIRGLTIAALAHVNFVSGLGNSCSQPLFANRPSCTQGSGRKIYSTWTAGTVFAAGKLAALNFAAAVTGANFVPGITPSFSHFRQPASAEPAAAPEFSFQ